MSYDPSVSHYRRAHTPKRLYLSPELQVSDMHKSFADQFWEISYELYKQQIKQLNISFAKLWEEECEVCRMHEVHCCEEMEQPHDLENFEQCCRHAKHLVLASEGRQYYR